jgi:predicted PurR-regulated permease PerM
MADGARARRSGPVALTILAAIAVVGALKVGQDVALPTALAMLIAFALSPVARFLQRRGLSRILAVTAAVTAASVAVLAFFLVLAAQLTQLAQELPKYQANIIQKLETLQEAGTGGGVVTRLSELASQIEARLSETMSTAPAEGTVAVEVVERNSPIETISTVVLPVLGPFATAGLVAVLVIFLLLERDQLRDRTIRLVGSDDVHRSSRLLEEAGSRVADYLLTQVLINAICALPVALGLWLIGVPNPILWALVTFVLRFVPFIGIVLAAFFPVMLAFAVSPDWSLVLWTGALFVGVEALASNILEPWLYGRRVGITALAIILGAMFWTWVWGPLGLLLSTPLMVCFVVLGRHLPQFEIFDILFGDAPALAPPARLYERLLAGDSAEVAARAEEAVEEEWLADYWRDVGLPALRQAQADAAREALDDVRETRVAETAQELVAALEPQAVEEAAEVEDDAPFRGRELLAVGLRGALDDVAASILAQTLRAEGATASSLPHLDLAASRFEAIANTSADAVLLVTLDPTPSRASLLHLRRIKRALPGLRVGLAMCLRPGDGAEAAEAARAIGADFAATGFDAAVQEALSDKAPLKPPAEVPRNRAGRPRRLRAAA